MPTIPRATALAGALLAATLLAGSVAAADARTDRTAAVAPCGMNDVSFYYGGFSQNLSTASFDITLLAHDAVACRLPDTPLISLGGPPSQKTPIPVAIEGRGGNLTLRPNSPLHATVAYSKPDLPENTIQASTLTLSMPDHSSRTAFFGVPGTSDMYKGGAHVTAWTTGPGLGEGEGTE
ncbi:hypothetical protein [Streptomyces sp. TS71-3]|uniref:hypothetical protein n=1 Tax=Streptomyces sp. TS71-3 TaxID=2733862 RepID=UPI001B0BA4ED|nr:hypothetical protein [Streptomyces sp. TS71-3]GHJ41937.1 hypothetical protein Sm713_75460 [Streptomyces sp. TS71-3]